MKTIIIKTQAELNSLPAKFDEFTYIEIRSDSSLTLEINKNPQSSQVTACDSSQVRAYGSSQVRAYDSSQVTAYGSSQVRAYDSSQVTAYGSSQVTACDSSQVTACDSSQVRAYGSSQVRAYGSSQVTACDSSQVRAYGSSQVRAYDSSQVRAYDSSQVTAYDSSQVRAYGNSMIMILSAYIIVKAIKDWAVVTLEEAAHKITLPKKSKTSHVIKRKQTEYDANSFADIHELEKPSKDSVVLYKSVNPSTGCDFQTGTIKYEGTVTCPDWDGDANKECGNGLHLSPTAQLALSYHEGKILRCEVKLKDIAVYSKNLTKVRCKKVKVLG